MLPADAIELGALLAQDLGNPPPRCAARRISELAGCQVGAHPVALVVGCVTVDPAVQRRLLALSMGPQRGDECLDLLHAHGVELDRDADLQRLLAQPRVLVAQVLRVLGLGVLVGRKQEVLLAVKWSDSW